MDKEYAIELLQQALNRLKGREGGTNEECTAGAYWRLAQVLELYLAPRMDKTEGKEHADFIRKNHGVICRKCSTSNAKVHGQPAVPCNATLDQS